MTQRSGGNLTTAQQSLNGFDETRAWVFDLDNTLYPAESNLFAQMNVKMQEFIAQYLGVPFAYARHLQKNYYREFGTTLAGLMKVHRMEPTAFLDYVHDLDLSNVPEHPELAAAIKRLPGRKLIFTAGSRKHAENVAGKLGVLHLFEDIMDIVDTNFVPKEQKPAFQKFLARHDVEPDKAAMFEDMPHNLLAPHDLGMTTVLVYSPTLDHPVAHDIRSWTARPDHIHHMTEDLCTFLDAIVDGPEIGSCSGAK
ncbi:MAG: pyrimidine 5'-nucleotidase [Hyphomicrobiales bacterium]|nr:pyrimidine 5'-nucleotidase [Hyphomicrobiales bacterium]